MPDGMRQGGRNGPPRRRGGGVRRAWHVSLATAALVALLGLAAVATGSWTPTHFSRDDGDGDPAASGRQAAAAPADLAAMTAEAASLRAAVGAERARLAALERQREELTAMVEALRRLADAARQSATEANAVVPPALATTPGRVSGGGRNAGTETAWGPQSAGNGGGGAETTQVAALPLPPAFVPAPAGTAPSTPPSPSSPTRAFVHHRLGSAVAEEAALATAAALREAGVDVAGLRAVGAVPAARVVRYFHSDDAPAASRLAGRLGRGWAIQDFRAYSPAPPPHTLEIWLPDR